MNCLECSLSPSAGLPMTAAASCAHCGAGVCLDHARVVIPGRPPIGRVPQSSAGERRIVCTTCYAGSHPGGTKAGMLTATAPAGRTTGRPADGRVPAHANR
jgi:hypothetical protein